MREEEAPQSEQDERRARRRARRKAHQRGERAERRLAALQLELETLRAFSLRVFPAHPVPAPLRARLDELRAEELTYLTADQLDSLVSCVLELEGAGRPGVLIEAGTARGGSAIAMAMAKAADRPLRVHDVFGMIPPPTDADGDDVLARYATIAAGEAQGRGEETYYGYRDDLLGEVTASFARHGVPTGEHAVTLVRGLFEDTLTGDEPVALAHVDGDWYESTRVCLQRLAPRLVPGGRIVVDDYYSWSGCRRAVDEFAHDDASRLGVRVEMRAKVHLVREG